MIDIKTPDEIKIMREGGKILASVLSELLKNIKPGISELDIDRLAEKLIIENGAEPGFKKVKGYLHSICVSTNDVVVHGVPTHYKFKAGDVAGIDCGVFYKGFHTDAAETLRVSTINNQQLTVNKKDEIDKFLETGKRALSEGIKKAKVGNRIGHISKAIQDIVEGDGYSIVRSLVGHGVGRTLHEEPEVSGFLEVDIKETPALKTGTTIAIEVIYNIGKGNVKYLNEDGWTISTADKSISGLFEKTIAITSAGPSILTA
ncbi:MAG: type I methionyl aminopeptidase [Candidatus Levybacteria bacterium RIFCSPHIGHO2_01_FULL_37_33]|nr:MAG: type I methionyl aminopeptidase [Candidatus Levybacteria bacterium RIFCSPHIGHO2_01_FULL_37_33]OGH32600.1 MAG: type I methionyl aminopeptidase [Candidatus Levybacteria bacterium RIFCSPLOWO2_01_FULL_36_54]